MILREVDHVLIVLARLDLDEDAVGGRERRDVGAMIVDVCVLALALLVGEFETKRVTGFDPERRGREQPVIEMRGDLLAADLDRVRPDGHLRLENAVLARDLRRLGEGGPVILILGGGGEWCEQKQRTRTIQKYSRN